MAREMRAVDDFWNDSDYFTGPRLTDAAIREAEKRLGYKLPEAYLRLLRVRNGGTPRRPYFHVEGLAGWDTGYFQVDGLRGIGGHFWAIEPGDDYQYPAIGV